MKTKSIVLIVLSILATIIIIQNTESAPFQVLFWEFSAPRVIFFLGFLLVGYSIGFLFGLRRKSRNAIKKAEKAGTR